MGIEPILTAWKADRLPLTDTRKDNSKRIFLKKVFIFIFYQITSTVRRSF